MFATIHKSNCWNIFFEKFLSNCHFLKVFFVILALISNKGTLLSLIAKIMLGHISESTKIAKLGDQWFKNLFINFGISKGKNWWIIFVFLLNFFFNISSLCHSSMLGKFSKICSIIFSSKSISPKIIRTSSLISFIPTIKLPSWSWFSKFLSSI